MMKVLQILNSLGRGGIETFVMTLCRNIDRSRISFDFAIMEGKSTDFVEEAIALGAKVYVYPPLHWKTVGAYIKWWKKFFLEHKKEYAVVHMHAFTTASFYLSFAKKAQAFTIVHSHTTSMPTNGVSKLEAYLRRALLFPLKFSNKVDCRCACSEDAGKWLFGENGHFQVIKNTIDIEKFKFNLQARLNKRRELGLRDDDILVGHVGNGTEAKNHIFLLKIFAEFYRNQKNARLVLIGKLGKREDEIKNFIQSKNLQSAVTILGVREDIPELLSAMDLFVFPSIYEGLAISLVEAQTAGVPCVCSDVVPKEARLSNLACCMPLSTGEAAWAQAALEHLQNFKFYQRENAAQITRNNGYDVADVIKEIQDLYFTANP